MARKRGGFVRESRQQLNALLRRHAGTLIEPRIRMLLHFSEPAPPTMDKVGALLGCAERTIRRWWKLYSDHGLQSLLAMAATRPVNATTNGSTVSSRMIVRDAEMISDKVVEFLNALPIIDNTNQWSEACRKALMDLLEDVDRVSINVNVTSDIHNREGKRTGIFITQVITTKSSGKPHSDVTAQRRRNRTPGELLLQSMKQNKLPLYDYHPPCYYDYYVGGSVYVGSIFLFREKQKRPISRRTLVAMERLYPFLTFLLSDCVARRQREDPEVQMFTNIITAIARQEGLTRRQQDVFFQQILGRSQEEIAMHLGVTLFAVQKHVTAIHQKTGTQTHTELLARYITPLGNSQASPPDTPSRRRKKG